MTAANSALETQVTTITAQRDAANRDIYLYNVLSGGAGPSSTQYNDWVEFTIGFTPTTAQLLVYYSANLGAIYTSRSAAEAAMGTLVFQRRAANGTQYTAATASMTAPGAFAAGVYQTGPASGSWNVWYNPTTVKRQLFIATYWP